MILFLSQSWFLIAVLSLCSASRFLPVVERGCVSQSSSILNLGSYYIFHYFLANAGQLSKDEIITWEIPRRDFIICKVLHGWNSFWLLSYRISYKRPFNLKWRSYNYFTLIFFCAYSLTGSGKWWTSLNLSNKSIS